MIVLILRVWMMITFPLTDKTESRYGELARVTAEGGYWLMPHMTPNEPFFAKPPLSTWMSSASWIAIGKSEFALRLPSFLMSVMTAGLVLLAARDLNVGRMGLWTSAASLVSSPMFIVSAGTVMTDSCHVACVTAAMFFAWRCLKHPDLRRWRICFWCVLGIATLAKGLATVALIIMPIVVYSVVSGTPMLVARRLWDPLGCLLASVITLSWYLAAERSYPGFLNYFLIGEHFQRFLKGGWKGDRYGQPHQTPMGMIWLYWCVAIGQWIPMFLGEAFRAGRNSIRGHVSHEDRWIWCWILMPLLFFSVSRNIIITYTLTAIPPFALLAARWGENHTGWMRTATPKCVFAFAIIVTAVGTTWLPGKLESLSARELIAEAHAGNPSAQIVVCDCYPFSASFYSRATIRTVAGDEIASACSQEPPDFVIISTDIVDQFNKEIRGKILTSNSEAVLLEIPRE